MRGTGREGVHLQDGMESLESGTILKGDRPGRRYKRRHGLEGELRLNFKGLTDPEK